MKKRITLLLACLLSVVLALAFAACGDDAASGELTLSDTSLSLTVGDTKQLTLKSGDTDVSKDATWQTSDDGVATVTSRGNVSARGEGSATITATYNDKSLACAVTVKPREVVTVEITDEEGKKLDSLTLERGKSATLKATASNGGDVTWSSADSASVTVAPVSGQKNTATVTGVFPTSAPVTVFATSGSARASVPVTVTASSEDADKGWYEMANRDGDGNMIDNGSIGQNRTPVNRWSYWCDMTSWEGGNVEIAHAEYLGDDDSSQAGSIRFEYEVTNAGRKPDSCLQITYRAPKTTKATASSEPVNNPKGLLERGKYYQLTCTIESDAAGSVVINGNPVELVNGTNDIVVYFFHDDDGAIHSPENGYGTAENQDYGPIQWTAFFLTTGEGLPKAKLTISNLQWTESAAPAALNAPTVTVADGKVTVNDTVNPEGAKNYTVGFFKNANDTTPAYVITANKGEATNVDTSRWNNGEYFVKAKANPSDGRFLESAWSAAAEGKLTVQNATVEYDIPLLEEKDIPANESGWWYYNEDGEQDTTVAHYKDGVVTFNFGTGTANWYSRQLFYRNIVTTAGQAYKFTFKIVANVAGDITVNGQVFSLVAGENNIEVSAAGGTGTLLSFQFGVMEPGTDGLTHSAIAEGEFTIKDFVMEEKVVETSGEIAKGGEGDAKPDEWTYWYMEQASWGGEVVDMLAAKNENGTITLSYQGGSVDYSVQLFYKDSTVETSAYLVTLNINCNVDSLQIKINGNIITLHKGDNAIELVCDLAQGGTTFSMQCNGNAEVTTLVLSDIAWEKTAREALATPTGLTIGADKTVAVTDTNGDKASGYKLTFTSGDTKYEITVQNGEKLNDSKLPDGTYDVAVTALGTGKYTDSPISQTLATYTVANGGVKYDLENIGAADLGNDQWAYWSEGAGTIAGAKYEDGVITLKITGLNSNWYSNQVFYKNSSLKAGASYTLKCVINTTKAGRITLNGKVFNLVVGDNNIEVTFTEDKAPAAASFSLQFGVNEGNIREIEDADITIKDVNWEEAGEPAPGPATPDALTAGGEGDAKTANDGWKYWNANGERNWESETEIYASVEVTEAKRENAVITLKFKGTAEWINYGLQLFYNDPATYPVGAQYKLTLHIKATYDCTVTINGQKEELKAGDDKDLEIVFTYNFHLDNVQDYDYGISLFDMQVKTEAGKDYELTLSNIKWEKQGGEEPQPQPQPQPAGGKEIEVTPTEWYGDSFVKISMSDEDFALVKEAANCKVNGSEPTAFNGNKGFLVDGNLLQVQLPEQYTEGHTYSVVWYDAEGNAIAHATFTYTK